MYLQLHSVPFQRMEEAEDEATRPPPTGDEGGEETQGANRENATEGGAAVTRVQGFTRETVGSGAVSEYMLEEGPLDDSTREEGEFSVPPTAASFYSLQVFRQSLDLQSILWLHWFFAD